MPQPIEGLGGLCLVPGFADVSGDTRAVIGECGGPESLWRLANPSHAEASVLVHEESGQCLDVAGGSDADGTPVILFDCHGDDNQRWRPVAETCTRDSFGVCLADERFRVDIEWRSFDGTTGSGRAGAGRRGRLRPAVVLRGRQLGDAAQGPRRLRTSTIATGSSPAPPPPSSTPCGSPTHALGIVREYFNPLGNAADAITDTDAFATCSVTSGPRRCRVRPQAPIRGAPAPRLGSIRRRPPG